MNFLKTSSKNLIGNRYNNFYNQIINKYINFKNKPVKTKLIFKVNLKEFQNKSFKITNIKNEFKKIENKISKHLIKIFNSQTFISKIQKQYINLNLNFNTAILKRFYSDLKKENQSFSIKENKYELKLMPSSRLNELKKTFTKLNKSLKNGTDSANFYNQFNYTNLSVSNIDKNKKEIIKNLENEFLNFKKYNQLASHPILNFKSLDAEINDFKNLNLQKTFKRNLQNQYFVSKINNIYLNKTIDNQLEKSKEFKITKQNLNIYLNSISKFHKTSKFLTNQKSIKTKSEFIDIIEKKVETSQKFLFRKNKTEELQIKKENKYEKLQKEIEKIKTQILIEKSESFENRNLEKSARTTVEKDKYQFAEEVYEIVLKKWEKDLMRRGLLNG